MNITETREIPWLLLVFSLPARRGSQRVEVWRRLQRIGAIALGNSGYLLPNRPTTREHFEWLATSIRNYHGEASVVEVGAIDNLSHPQLVAKFHQASERSYQALLRELHRLGTGAAAERSRARMSRLRQHLAEIAAIDFFGSPLRSRAEELMERIQKANTSPLPAAVLSAKTRKQYRGRLWVTRPRPGVDRVHSAWLVRRFIDPRARFGFAREGEVPRDAVPFDMYQGGFGHHGDDCTFETLVKQFRIRDRRAAILAQIVHDADLGDAKFGRKEGFGVDEVLKGWDRQGLSDREILARGLQLVEGLYHSLG